MRKILKSNLINEKSIRWKNHEKNIGLRAKTYS